MHVDTMTLARARLAMREAIRRHLYDPNVGLIDFGHPEHEGEIAWDELAIRVHVKKKLDQPALEMATMRGMTTPIPPYIGGFPTDVPEGVYRPRMSLLANGSGLARPVNLHQALNNPIRGGISISDEFHIAAGTLGGIVVDRASGAQMILSNWHVLVSEWTARAGQRIYQPGRLDGGSFGNTIATLTRNAMPVNLDAAVATLTGSRQLIIDQLELGIVTGVGQASIDMQLIKSGRTSGVTEGVVTAIQGTAKITYSGLPRLIRDVITIEPLFGAGEVSQPGDSGSWWLDSQTMQAIGLHFAGSDFPERGLALDMQAVLDALNVDLALGQPAPSRAVAGFGVPAVPQRAGLAGWELVTR